MIHKYRVSDGKQYLEALNVSSKMKYHYTKQKTSYFRLMHSYKKAAYNYMTNEWLKVA